MGNERPETAPAIDRSLRIKQDARISGSFLTQERMLARSNPQAPRVENSRGACRSDPHGYPIIAATRPKSSISRKLTEAGESKRTKMRDIVGAK